MKITERDAHFDPNYHLIPGILEEVSKELGDAPATNETLKKVFVAINPRVNKLIDAGEFRTSYIDIDGRTLEFLHVAVKPIEPEPGADRIGLDVCPVWAYTTVGVYDDEE